MTKMIVIVVVVVLIVAAIAGAFVVLGENKSPTAVLTVDSDQVELGTAIEFNATQSSDDKNTLQMGENDLTYEFFYGDGNSAKVDNPVVKYTYTTVGNMLAWVVVKDSDGASDTSEFVRTTVLAVEVTPANDSDPVAVVISDAGISENIVGPGTTVTFSGTSSYRWVWDEVGDAFVTTNKNLSYSWSVNGVNAGSDVNLTRNFTDVGNYVVKFTVVNALNTTLMNSFIVTVVVEAAATGGTVPRADTFVEVTIGEPDNLDPAVDYETAGGEVIANVYETLVWYNGSSAVDLVPLLATAVPTVANGGISADGLTYTYNLRANVKFHNGETMTSEDVVYSISRVLMINDADGPAWMLGQVLIKDYYDMAYVNQSECAKGIWAVDGDTVQFNLTMPYPAFNYIMAYTVGSVVSKKFVEDNGGITLGEQSQFMNSNTCGTGPYTMEKWVRNQQILLERNENYWRAVAPIQYVIIKKANDYGTRLMMMQAGDADTAYIPRIHQDDVLSNDKFRVVKDLPTFTLDFMGLNQKINMTQYNSVTGGKDTITSTFFADPDVRLAFAHSFDYNQAIETYFAGGAIQPNGIIPMGMFGYNDTVPLYEYNLTLAAQFLNQAVKEGTITWGEAGFKITLMYNAGNEWRALECQLLKEGLEQLEPLGYIEGKIH